MPATATLPERGAVTARRSWLDGRVDVLLAAPGEYGMGMSRPAAAALIGEDG